MVRLETARLRLRPLTLDDEDALLAYQSDPVVVRYVPWDVRSRSDVRDAILRFAGKTTFDREGDGLLLAIERREDGRVIGQCNIAYESEANALAEIGYVVGRPYAGAGYATEAARALLAFGFGTGKLHRIVARTDARNTASAAVCEKLGMRREAEFVEDDFFKGEWSTTWVYAMLRREWDASAFERG